jgi:hypothetical protein
MFDFFSPFINLPIAIIAAVAVRMIIHAAVLYLLIIYPRSDSGFYSFHPVKRLAIFLFLPFVLLYIVFLIVQEKEECMNGDDWDEYGVLYK